MCGVNLTEEPCTGSDGCKQSTCELSVVCVVDTECSGSVCGVNLTEEPYVQGVMVVNVQSTCELSVVCVVDTECSGSVCVE